MRDSESYNRKQTHSDLKDLLIPRQKVSGIFMFDNYVWQLLFILIHSFSSQTYISLLLKQQASLYISYKGQLTFYKSLSKKINVIGI